MSTNWTEIDTCTNNIEKKNLWEKVMNELNALCSRRKSVGATLKTTFMDITDQVENQTGIGGGPGSERWEHFETMALIIGCDSTVIPRNLSEDDDEGDDDEGEIDDGGDNDNDGNDDNSDAEGPEQQQQQNRRQRQRNHQQGQVGRRQRRRTVHEDVGRHHEAMMEVVGNLVNIMDGMKNTLERSIEADQATLERWQQDESRRHDDFIAVLMAIRTELRGDTNTNADSNTNN
ncbi:hypothetical protein BC941DRAFT_444917 [Chlamydoabsidia padenii]|nr:hypothetical protein BC941DRAFT_444917 [Chlamydoabsidia padenii]